MAKIGRNAPCPCGSGRKFKRCHGSFERMTVAAEERPYIPMPCETLRPSFAEAARRLREQQQGQGKPIITAKHGDTRFVATGNMLHYSKNWLTFIDFLMDYLKGKLGLEWWQAQIKKPEDERHPFFEWLAAMQRQNKAANLEAGKVHNHILTGATASHFGLAYNLYLLEHNVELQERYLQRLRNTGNFQGAYYELIIAGTMIEAGFELTLEDEVDDTSKHCEFSAISKKTGRRYWVEAKMRGVEGILGRTAADGVSQKVVDPTTRVTEHINKALKKPADDERIIFIDVNAPIIPEENPNWPNWVDKAISRLEAKERALGDNQRAYVFITNIAFHRYLDEPAGPGKAVLAYGLGLDFGKTGFKTILESYKNKHTHIDAHDIIGGLRRYPNLPSTFDGTLPSETYGKSQGIKIGETYFFEDVEGGLVGEVTAATVDVDGKSAAFAILTKDQRAIILKKPMSDDEIADYKRHSDVFFGEVSGNRENTDDPVEFFEWLLKTYEKTSKEKLLEFMKDWPGATALQELDQHELALRFCEAHTIGMLRKAAPETLRFGPERPQG